MIAKKEKIQSKYCFNKIYFSQGLLQIVGPGTNKNKQVCSWSSGAGISQLSGSCNILLFI